MKSLIKLSMLASVITLTLSGCGGGSGDSSTPEVVTTPPPVTTAPEPMKIQGLAIDGYIVGATIFMDLNFNGVFDENEPHAITENPHENGSDPGNLHNWTIEIPGVHEDCGQYVPLVTHVPVGAIDLDDPENPIEEEYYLTIPPSFAVATDEDMRKVTPLTTVLWNQIERELKKDDEELTCESIINNQHLRKKITARLQAQEKRIAARYNTTVKSLYGDFVAKGDKELHGIARSLVPGLAKGLEDSVALEKANPNSRVAYVEYYFKDNNAVRGQNWSRREYVQTAKGNWDEIGNLMSQGLKNKGQEIYRRQQRTNNASGLEIEVAANLENGECTVAEYFTEKSGTTGYALVNIAAATDVGWSNCLTMDRVALNVSQMLMTKTYYSDGDTVKTESGHSFVGDNPYKYTSMIGASASDLSGGWLSSSISHISLSFEDDYGYDSDHWYRIDNRYSSEEFWNATQEVHMHNSDDVYEVTTYNPDGTWSKQCGTWTGGTGSLSGC